MSRTPAFRRALAALACAPTLLLPLAARADTCSGLSLAALTPVGAGTNPNGVAVGDFNRDGKLDVAVVNSGSNNVSILIGDGNGGFTNGPGSPITTGSTNPVDIAAGDLNGDGILDLVVAFGSSAQAQVLQGIGTGGFNAAGTFALNTIPSRIYLADFNRDADLDLVVLAEANKRLLLYGGAAGVTFNGAALTDIDLSGIPGEQPSGAAVLDFNRDGKLDLAVVMRNTNNLRVYFGTGSGLLVTGPQVAVGGGPSDVVAGDVDRDGWPDLVTANTVSADASVLLNNLGASLTPQTPVTVGGVPLRVALVDLNHDGILELAALDDSPTPRVPAFQGLKTGPAWFDVATTSPALPGTGGRGLVVGRFTADGRADLVTAVSSIRGAVAIENRSGTPCARASFVGAPRSYLTGDGPTSTAAADFDGDGRQDLVVATMSDRLVRILRNANGDFAVSTSIGPLPLTLPPVAVATADLNADGNMDVVVAQGITATAGQVQVLLGNGTGGLTLGAFQPAGLNTSALVIGDFNGDGAPDVVATSEDTGQVFRFNGDGLGGLGAGLAIAVGAGPHALVAADFDGNGTLDLAVANSLGNNVSILGGNGNGTFTPGPVLAVGLHPQGIAAADLNGDGKLDIVTADNGASQVSVILQNPGGGFLAALPYPVGASPNAVALVDLEGDPKPEIAVATAAGTGDQTLAVLTNNGSGVFTAQTNYPVRQSPQAVTPIDADSDGLTDLAVPCRSADAVVVLIHRTPGPPSLLAAPRYAVHGKPHGAAVADFNGDGKLDMAVANSGDNNVSLLLGDGLGGLAESGTLPATSAEAVTAGDFNLDGKIDLAVSAPGGGGTVEIFLGNGNGSFGAPTAISGVGIPDDLVVGDFDKDGDLDIAVCDKSTPTGSVKILRNNGPGVSLGTFTLAAAPVVGNKPTAIVAADFDGDGDLDLAVANDDSDNVMILRNTAGVFATVQTLTLLDGDTSPVSLAVGDFDGDGKPDLAAASIDKDRVHVFQNLGATFSATPLAFSLPYVLQFITTADVNRDGKPDLVAVARGLSVLRGKGALDFEAAQTVVAGQQPIAAVVADFDRDGRPDVAVINESSNDVTMLTSSACSGQRLEATLLTPTCDTATPFVVDASVKIFDDGGNPATCAAGNVTASILPNTAVLGGPTSVPFVAGVASFSSLTVDRGGRYRLKFQALGPAPVLSHGITLSDATTTQILGPDSVCPLGTGVYSSSQVFDTYAWTLTPGPAQPFAYTPSVSLTGLATGSYLLGLVGRDECVTSVGRTIYFGDLASVTLSILGASSVCVDCIGGSAKAIDTGGGLAFSRQWGFRTISGSGAITPIAGETGDTYVLKGASFPGPGTYYVVETTTPTCGSPSASNEWTVNVVADVPTGEVLHLAAASRGTPASGQNRLLWVNTTAPLEVRIRWNRAPIGTSACLPPASISDPFDGEAPIGTPSANAKDSYLHAGLSVDTAYCYSVFVRTSTGWSAGRTVKARPFDSTAGPVKWAYATGGTAVAPPTVSGPGILAMSNDRTVHALDRGSTGGEWPTNWMPPTDLVGVAHSRSPVVPFVVPLAGADTVLFTADDAAPGFVHAIDARTGNRPWAAQNQGLAMTGAPGGMFTQYGGVRDALFVGTRDSNVDNQLRALALATGAFLEAYTGAGSPGPIGPIDGSPAIDYASHRIYFASRARLGGDTLFCLEISPAPATPVFTYKWSRNLGNIVGSPVLRGTRVYVGTETNGVFSLDAMTGGDDHTYPAADGPVKGFLFPDRRNDDLFFATDTTVWSISDNGPVMSLNWQWTIGGLNPSIVLLWPQTSFVYVGSANGALYQLDFSLATGDPQFAKLVTLGDGLGQVGAPSLDIGVTPQLLIVGSEPGVLYGLEVPFP